MGASTKIYLKNERDLLTRVQDFLLIQLGITDISFYDFTKYSGIPNLVISSDIGQYALDTYEEPSYWRTKPEAIECTKDSPVTFINDNMTFSIHPDILIGLTGLLNRDESIYLIHHHERGDNPYDDLMLKMRHESWFCHLRGYEGDTMESILFDFTEPQKDAKTTKGEFNWNFINEKLKINNELLLEDGVNIMYCQGHYDIDDLDLKNM